MKLIVGLGNPGTEYKNTRHNIGFYYIDNFVNKLNLDYKEKFNGLYIKTKIDNEDVIFLKPQTYMNLSGECVLKFVNYYKIKVEDILIIHDDLDMDIGRIKLKENGSSGGHNGIKNIILHLNSENFKRLKIGIGKNKNFIIKDYVISKLTNEEQEIINNNSSKIYNILIDYFKISFNDLMSKYNRR